MVDHDGAMTRDIFGKFARCSCTGRGEGDVDAEEKFRVVRELYDLYLRTAACLFEACAAFGAKKA